jgi:hypothetical protein
LILLANFPEEEDLSRARDFDTLVRLVASRFLVLVTNFLRAVESDVRLVANPVVLLFFKALRASAKEKITVGFNLDTEVCIPLRETPI